MEGLCLTQLPISPEAVRQTKHSHYFNSNQATAAVCFPALSSAPTMACAVYPASSASCLAGICSGLGVVIGEHVLTLFLVEQGPYHAPLRTKMVPIHPDPDFFDPSKMESWHQRSGETHVILRVSTDCLMLPRVPPEATPKHASVGFCPRDHVIYEGSVRHSHFPEKRTKNRSCCALLQMLLSCRETYVFAARPLQNVPAPRS
nr:uncharacterized protein LOC106848301 isoform X2 [Equus asinus]